ncbi:MAG TPA: DUF4253 domain-containing protein [Labilithrix sp.]|nr:DUF4253 domain-containing protein [Labilithrix sp.]
MNDPGARLALAKCAPGDVSLALPIYGGNAAPNWNELAGVLASWHERYGARLRYTDGSSFDVVAERVPRSLEELRRLAHEQALLGCDYEFRFDTIPASPTCRPASRRSIRRSRVWLSAWMFRRAELEHELGDLPTSDSPSLPTHPAVEADVPIASCSIFPSARSRIRPGGLARCLAD